MNGEGEGEGEGKGKRGKGEGKLTEGRGLLETLDQYQYLTNCPPTPPLTQQQSIDKVNVGLGEG